MPTRPPWAAATAPSDEDAAFDQLLGDEPTPAFAAQVAEECQRLLGSLGDADLPTIAVCKMEGYTTEEIAAKLRRTPRAVERNST